MGGNTVSLSATLTAIDPLRHTPAGLPVVDFTLAHASSQTEAGNQRRIEFDMPAKATGDLATRIAQMRQGCQVTAQGFLNRRHRMSRQLVLHVTNMEILKVS